MQMLLATNKVSARSALPRSATPLLPRAACKTRRVHVCAQTSNSEQEAGNKELLAALALIGSFTVVQSVQAATDPYEELKSITAARTGSSSLLESFGAVQSSKADRGIRERLAAEAANETAPSTRSSSSSSSGFKFSVPSPKPAAPLPSVTSLFGSAAPKPAAAAVAPKPAAPTAAAAGGSVGAFAPLLQAAGVLGLVGVGVNAVTNFATSNRKGSKAKAASSAPAAAAAAPPKPAAAAASSTGKVSATKKITKSATGKVTAGAAAAASSTRKIVNKVPTSAAAAAGTVKGTLKKALVNEEKPDEPTDFAVAGILGFAALLGAFFLFGLPQPKTVEPPASPEANDPLVQLAKESARTSSSSYTTPLFKSLSESDAAAERRVVVAAKPAPEVKSSPPAAAPAEVKMPAAVKVEAPTEAAAAPAAVVEAKEVKQEPAAAGITTDEQQQEGVNPVFLGIAGLGVVVGAFALTGGSSSDSSSSGSGTESAAGGNGAAAPAETSTSAEGSAAAASADGSRAAETVSAAASAAAASAPGQGAPGDNAAYEQAVNALYMDPDTADDLYSIIQPSLRNPPALAWALISNQTNAETLDGWAFQKLSKARYERVRGLLVKMGLQLPETPKPQPVMNMTAAAAAAGGAAELDPEKLRGVFEALLANPASRNLMKSLLSGAGMPFNEDAFEEQIKDAAYFNLAIAPILRKMPPQKLAVLADLQDPAKLQELVRSVSNLAADSTQLKAVTAELSGDVRSTVEKIRETESSNTTTAASR